MKLSDTHLVLLSAASQRDDHALELPADMDPAEAEKLVSKLAGAGLIEEIEATGELPVWRRVDDAGFALRITGEGLKAIGVDEGGPVATDATEAVVSRPRTVRSKKKTASAARRISKTRKPRTSSSRNVTPKTAPATRGGKVRTPEGIAQRHQAR